MRKKNQKYVWIGAIIAVIVVIALIAGKFEFSWSHSINIKTLAIGDVPTGCNVGGSGTTANEFVCPGVCDVNGWDDCQAQTGEIPTVIFRTNAKTFSDYNTAGNWIAINCIPSGKTCTPTSDLHGYCYSSSTSGGGVDIIQITPTQNFIKVYNSKLLILSKYQDSAQTMPVYRVYQPCSDADLSLTPKSPYTENNQEITGGSSNPFQCSKAWRIENGGIVKSSGTASYSSISGGKYETGIKRLAKGDKFIFPGSINYAVIDTSSSCVRDTCTDDGLGVIKCLKDSNGCPIKDSKVTNCITGEFCTQLDSGAVCEAPFEESFEIKDGFTTAEPITFNYGLKSTRVSNAFVTFTLRNTNNRQQAIQVVGPTSLSLPVTGKPITFVNPGLIGTYEIVVDKNYDGKSVSPEVYAFTVGNPLELTIKIPYSDLTGLKLIADSQFYIDVGVSENGILIPDLVSVNAIATLTTPDGTVKNVNIPTPILKNDYLRYYFTVGEPGRFKFTAKASKFGVETIEKETSSEIRVPKIDITYTNINQLTNTKPGLKTIKFETKDAFGDYITTDYTVKITPSGASTGSGDIDVTAQVRVVETGKYEFDYSFPSGAYIIKVKASASGYPGFSEQLSASINIDETGSDKQCGSSVDCPAGQTCNSNGQCVNTENPTWVLYAIVIGAIIFAGILIIVIVNLSRKKTTKVNIGAGL